MELLFVLQLLVLVETFTYILLLVWIMNHTAIYISAQVLQHYATIHRVSEWSKILD
jgi:hypothetical protein